MKKVIATKDAPSAVGPYSQAIVTANLIFCSGQIPLDPATGQILEGDIAAQTGQVLRNLAATLQAAGAGLGQVVKTTIFLTDMSQFTIVNEVYETFFPKDPPARSTVEVAALPRGAKVEIEAVAVIG
jgi:2-iminobutanoate/2-iminopropanoate deaminase